MAITLNYGLQITGDCQNNSSGALGLTIYGGTPNYTITWLSPSLSPIILAGSATTITSLSGGSYSFYVSDQSIPVNNTNNISFYVSTGCCVSIDVQDTTCNLPNGSLTATTAYASSYGTAYLYKEGQYISSALTSFVTQDAPPPLSPVPGLLTSAYFDGLSAGTYQVTLFDYGGCQCSSQTCIIRNSSEFGFGLKAIYNPALFHIEHGRGGGGFLDGVNKKTNDQYRAIIYQEQTENTESWGFGNTEIEFEIF